MVGKPNVNVGNSQNIAVRGSAVTTQGLDALDQERASSLADEGGAAGAYTDRENEDEAPVRNLFTPQKPVFSRKLWVALPAVFSAGVIAGYYASRRD